MTATHSSPLITPASLGLPPKFKSFRPGQLDTVFSIVSADQLFISGTRPTGSGKSVDAVASAIMNGGRTVICTSTKILEDQYMTDFSSIGMIEMRGQSNFRCSQLPGKTCADGRKRGCNAKALDECPYVHARAAYLSASLAVTNYDYYLASNIYGDGNGPIDLLVLDEAHHAVQQLSDALTIKLRHPEFAYLYNLAGNPPINHPIAEWRAWAAQALNKLTEHVAFGRVSPSDMPEIERYKHTLSRLTKMEDTWINEENEKEDESQFAPLWPTAFARKILFGNAKKVLLLSATMVPKILTLLDIDTANTDECLMLETRYSFPSYRAPVYLFGAHKIDYRTTDGQWAETIGRMDTLLDRRLDRKSIVHSVSYEKQQFIYNKSDHSEHMLTPRAGALHAAVREFKNAPPPKILVSPALTTGYDFAYGECEFQIIIKLPFVDTRGPIMAARVATDKEYANLLTAQNFMQMCGRPMRAEDDQCETVVLDAHANWFLRSAQYKGFRHLFTDWFLNLIRDRCNSPPVPPPPLGYW